MKELVDYLENDLLLRTVCETLFDPSTPDEGKEFIRQIGLPIQPFESKEYRKQVFAVNEEQSRNYFHLYNAAIYRDKAGEKLEAAKAFTQCIDLALQDGDSWSGLANVLADTRQFAASFKCFKKALELLPNDPFVMRNYTYAMMESGVLYRGMYLLMDLYEKYPLFGSIGHEIDVQLERFIQMGWLPEKEAEILKERWNALLAWKQKV